MHNLSLVEEIGRLRSRIRQLEQAQRRLDHLEIPSHDLGHFSHEDCPFPYQSLDTQGRLLAVNDAWLQVLGYERHEVLGHGFGEFLMNTDRALFRERFVRFKDTGKVEQALFEMVDRQGQSLLVEFNGMAVYDAAGNFHCSHCHFRDVTQRVLAERSLALTNRILQAGQRHEDIHTICIKAVRGIQDLFCFECVGVRLLDGQGNIPYEAYVGFPASFYEKESPLSVERDHCMCIEVIKGRLDPALPFVTEGGSFFMNGTSRFLATVSEADKGQTRNVCNQYGYESVALVPIRDNGDILGLIHIADTRENRVPEAWLATAETVALQLATVIKRAHADQRLRDKEATERALLNAATESAILVDVDGRILAINEVGASRLGGTSEELVGRCAFDLFPADLAESRRRRFQSVVESGQPMQFEDVRAGRTLDQRLCPILSDTGQVEKVAVFARDLTELHRQEEAYRDLVDHSLQGLVIVQDRRIVFANQALADMLGYTVKDLTSQAADYLSFLVHPDDRAMMQQYADARSQGREAPSTYQIRTIHKDGSTRWAQLFVSLIDYQGRPAMQAACIDITERRQAEEQLQASEQQFRELARLSPAGIYQTDAQGQCVYVNECWCNMAGLSQEQALGDGWIKALHPNDRDHVSSEWYAHANQEKPWSLYYRFVSAEGNVTWIYGTAVTLRDVEGKITGYLGVNTDFTQLKQAEEKLKTQQYYLQKAQEIGRIGTWELDLQENILRWTDENYRIFGLPLGAVLTYEAFLNCVHPEDREFVHAKWSAGVKGEPYDIEHRIIVDGRVKWVREKAEVAFDEQGNAVKAIGFAQDVTERKLDAQHLQEQHAIFNQLVEQTLAGYWDWRIQENTEYLSPTFKRMFGYEDHELANVPETWQQLIFPEDLPGVFELFQRHVDSRGQVPYYNEVRYRHKDGSTVWVICTGQVIEWGPQGEPLRMVGCHVDITKRKQAELMLRRSEQKFRSLFEQASDYLLLFEVTGDEDLVIVDANQAACEMHGYDRAEFLGMSFRHIDRGLDKPQLEGLLDRVMNGKAVLFETLHARKDGSVFPVEVSAKLLDTATDRTLIISVERDVTERKRVEEQLKQSERRSRAWLDNSPVCTKIVDLDFNLQYMSAAGVKQLQMGDVTQFYGKPYPFSFYPESFRQTMTENLIKAKQTGETVTQEASVVDTQGNALWYHSTLVPVKDDTGQVEYIIIVSVETTERRRAEAVVRANQAQLKSLAAELVLAEERERNRLAVHLHDDVCQNLAYAKMRLQMLSGGLDNQTHLNDVTEVTEALTQMMQEVRSLTFELSTPVLSEFGLETAISHWLEEQIEQKHGMDTTFTDDGQTKPLTEDIQALLFRSVRELLTNVVKHSQAQHVDMAVSRDGGQILICLEDDGIGFNPGEVVVGRHAGGFGLFSIRERLSQMGGSLEIESSPGQGCRSLLRAPLLTSSLQGKHRDD